MTESGEKSEAIEAPSPRTPQGEAMKFLSERSLARLEQVLFLRRCGYVSKDEARGLLGAPTLYERHPCGALVLTDYGLRRWGT